MTMTNYNEIADGYTKSKLIPAKLYAEEHTFFLALEDVKGLSILDLACGDGYYTRAVKKLGARTVTGVDVSEVMIELAQQEEKAQRLGINYVVKDIAKTDVIGEFDIITAVYLLPHAKTRSELQAMCDAIFRNLKPNGRFIAVTIDPNISIKRQPILEKYGFHIQAKAPLKNGMPLTVTLLTPYEPIYIKDYYWSEQTYERHLRIAGFHNIAWRPMQVSNEALAKFGNEYWLEFLDNPGIIILEAQK
jgi:SAM-dependent methyltransferase